jgi:hypothetical protein
MHLPPLTTLVLGLSVLVTTALANAPSINPNAQSCKAVDQGGSQVRYTLYVGEPFNQAACDGFYKTMVDRFCYTNLHNAGNCIQDVV